MTDRIEQLAEQVRRGIPRAAARAIRIVDDRMPGFEHLLCKLYPHTGSAEIIGITGSPGAGKSTLVERLIEHYRKLDRRVGVLAVDPSSPYTGGALLGDRIRMQKHFLDPKVFIRSLATRGAMGGLSHAVMNAAQVLDAFGCDVVIVETVGVGQDELDVARLAHTTVVLSAPGLGDDIQAVKAGVLEIADLFVINKADRAGADAAVADLEQMIALTQTVAGAGSIGAAMLPAHAHHGPSSVAMPPSSPEQTDQHWRPCVLKTVATQGEGIEELAQAISRHHQFLQSTEEGMRRRKAQLREQMQWLVEQEVLREARELIGRDIDRELDEVSKMTQDPYTVAKRLSAKLLRR